MRLMHISDLHIGKSLNDFDLFDDQKFILEGIIKTIIEKKVECLLICGDVYDKAIPSEAAVEIFDAFLSELAKNKVKTFIISGNHDSDTRLNFGSSLFENSGIYICSRYEGFLRKVTLEDKYGELDIYMLPFVKASAVRHFFPDETIENYNDALQTIISKAEIDTARRSVILAHQFVVGSIESGIELGGSESLQTKSVGTVEMVEAKAFKDFDYTALGHIHKAQKVGTENIRYSGSPLKYSVSEAMHSKSIPIIDIKEKGKMKIELVSIKPLRDLRHIEGPLQKLLDVENVVDTDDYIYATLTDEEMHDNIMGIFQQTYPNTVKVDYNNTKIAKLLEIDDIRPNEKRPYSQLVAEFYKTMYATEISEKELEIMIEVGREAGVDLEA